MAPRGRQWLKVVGAAGVVGVAATGILAARTERRRQAYAPDEILITLGLAGGVFVATHSWYITIAVVFVMAVVVASYRQNVHAYPSGGGDYEVATTNLGPKAGLTVASALLVDYTLTVAVSVSS